MLPQNDDIEKERIFDGLRARLERCCLRMMILKRKESLMVRELGSNGAVSRPNI